MKRPTLGKIATDLNKQPKEKVKVLVKAAEMKQDYMPNIFEAVDRGCEKYKGNFFIEAVDKQEKLTPNVFRTYYIDVMACPSPSWDHSVFRYNRKEGRIEYLWTLPRRDDAIMMLENAKEIMNQPNETGEKELLRFVMMALNGALFKMMKAYNGEQPDSPLIIT